LKSTSSGESVSAAELDQAWLTDALVTFELNKLKKEHNDFSKAIGKKI
jgi:hypothetical protein